MSSEHTEHTAPTVKTPIVSTPAVKPVVVRPRTLVVAGTVYEFDRWRREDYQARKDTQYVSEAYHARGYAAGTTLHFLGTYYKRNDLHALMEYGLSYNYNITFGKSA